MTLHAHHVIFRHAALTSLCSRQPSTSWYARQHIPRLYRAVVAGKAVHGKAEEGNPKPAPRRREFLMASSIFSAAFWNAEPSLSPDGRTVVNSILGAYGLPQLKALQGFKLYDDFDADYTFAYPRSWVGHPNRQRAGLYLSDFNTADKVVVEVLEGISPGASQEALVKAAIAKLIVPAGQAAGDSKLEMPPENRVKVEAAEHEGQSYVYFAFPSETLTRSGYSVQRKNIGVVASRGGRAYVLGASARSDQASPEKLAVLGEVVQSFRLR